MLPLEITGSVFFQENQTSTLFDLAGNKEKAKLIRQTTQNVFFHKILLFFMEGYQQVCGVECAQFIKLLLNDSMCLLAKAICALFHHHHHELVKVHC